MISATSKPIKAFLNLFPRIKNNFSRRSGFTFIELFIVIIIIGILFAISIPQFRKNFDNLELENFVKNIYYTASHLQSAAVSQTQIYYLKIDAETGQFQAMYKTQDKELKKITGPMGKVYKAPENTTVTVEPRDIEGSFFYPDGSCDPVTIVFKNKENRQISLLLKGANGGLQIQ